MFQCFQPVKIAGDHPDAGKAGSVRQDVRTVGSGKAAADLVAVQLDDEGEPRDFPVANVQPL